MKIGIIGLGYWGPNIVRNFLIHPKVASAVCCDLDATRLEFVKKRFPSVETVSDYRDILKDPSVVAVAVVTPVQTHFKFAKEALEAGKHLLVEKPMTDSLKDAQVLVDLAAQRNLVLMVDHTFVYTGAVQKMKELIQNGEAGDLLYFDSVRVNLGLFQHDINVLWDLAPHDLSIMEYLIPHKPVSVAAFGASHFSSVENIAYLIVNFSERLIAHFHVNWLSPVKVRTIFIGGSNKLIVYDDMEPSEKVKVYDRGIVKPVEESLHQALVQYRMGDMYAPHLDHTEALVHLCDDFVSAISTGKKPLSDGVAGLNVVRILEAAQQSLRKNGSIVPCD